MKQMRRNIIMGWIAFFVLLSTVSGHAAVDSRGEINVKDDDQGRVPTSSIVTLIMTLTIDRSLAEPGEEIKTIEIRLPAGFSVQPLNFQSMSRDGQQIGANAETTGSFLRVVLESAIDDFSNSTYDIIFESRTPEITAQQALFQVRLRNLADLAIGEFIKPGNVDGRPNNDDFTLQVIPNIPPAVVEGFTVESDPTGENDVTIRWQKSDDPDVNGYFIQRDTDPPIDVDNRSATVFRDVNVTPGVHSYVIRAYKTPLLQSERSAVISVLVSEDTAPPAPPERLTAVASGDGIKLTWEDSPSRDVTIYQVFFGASQDQLTPLTDVDATEAKYEFTDDRLLGVGVFVYAVEAIDEAGNRSEQVSQTLRILGEPFPNPFTPLSGNPDFNRIVFPTRAIEGAEGEFTVLIFDITGVRVRELRADAGMRELAWDGTDEDGEIVESGVYVYQLQVGESFKTGTVIVAK